jgi:branched-chain amino acid transport system permease protein
VSLTLQLVGNAIAHGAMAVVLALGFGLVYRSVHVFHAAFGSTCVLASYVFYTLVAYLNFNYWAAGLASVLISAGIGCLLEICFYRPFFKRRMAGGAVMVASFGLGMVIQNVLAILFGNETATLPPVPTNAFTVSGAYFSIAQVLQVVFGTSIVALLGIAGRGRSSLVLRAMATNQELLMVQGWSIFRFRTLVFALSGALVAVPGCLIMMDTGMDPHGGTSYLLVAVVAVLVGGVSHAAGWIIAAMAIAILQSLVALKFSTMWMDTVAFVLLIVVMLFRRQGLIQFSKRAEES